jgi:hypothetical protein
MSNEITPLAKVSYLNKSYKELREELLAKAPLISGGVWTDLNSAELLTALLELVLGVNDLNMFYFDHQSNEAFLRRANERKNVVAHCNMLSYRLSSWTPSKGNVTVKLKALQSGHVSIPKYTKLKSSSDLVYYVTNTVFLTSNNPIVTLDAAQGVPNKITYRSNGMPDQQYIIPSKFMAEGSITVSVNDLEWLYVDDGFAKSGPYSEHYVLRSDSAETNYIVFGDDVIGKIPPDASLISLEWADTLGPAGNVRANQIKGFDNDSEFSNISIVTSTNFSGGAQPESIEEAKKLAPMSLRALWKGVTRDDFITLTEHFPGVRQASVLDINDFPIYSFKLSYYEVVVVVIPQEGEFLSDQFKLEVQQYLDERKYVTCDIRVENPEYVRIDIEAAIYKYRDYDERAVIANVESVLADFFTIAESPVATYRMTGRVDGMVLGGDLRFSVLVAAIQSVPGVSYVDLVTPTSDVPINFKQIAVIGELKLSVSDITNLVAGNYSVITNS